MNNFHLYEEIGQSNHSTVYKGRKRFTIEYLAIRSSSKDLREILNREVAILSKLYPISNNANLVNNSKSIESVSGEYLSIQSPETRNLSESIATLYGFYETRNHLWCVSEYLPGGNLAQLLEFDGSIPGFVVMKFLSHICRGLHYLHDYVKVIYGDLRPSNILLSENGSLKLSGFGYSSSINDNTHNVSHESKYPRNLSYASPEILYSYENGDIEINYSTDLWSLGAVLFECYFGCGPFNFTGVNCTPQDNLTLIETSLFNNDYVFFNNPLITICTNTNSSFKKNANSRPSSAQRQPSSPPQSLNEGFNSDYRITPRDSRSENMTPRRPHESLAYFTADLCFENKQPLIHCDVDPLSYVIDELLVNLLNALLTYDPEERSPVQINENLPYWPRLLKHYSDQKKLPFLFCCSDFILSLDSIENLAPADEIYFSKLQEYRQSTLVDGDYDSKVSHTDWCDHRAKAYLNNLLNSQPQTNVETTNRMRIGTDNHFLNNNLFYEEVGQKTPPIFSSSSRMGTPP